MTSIKFLQKINHGMVAGCLIAFHSTPVFADGDIANNLPAQSSAQLSASTTGQTKDQESRQLLIQYFALAEVNTLLDSVPNQIEAMYQDSVVEQGEDASDSRILLSLLSAWHGDDFKSELISRLSKSISHSELTQLVHWQQGDLARQIKQQDLLSEQPEFAGEFFQFSQKLPHSLPSQHKMILINELIEAKQMVNGMVDVTLSVSRPVLTALASASLEQQEEIKIETIEQQISELGQLLETEMSMQIALLSYYLYRNVPEDTLIAYTEFYQSALGQLELKVLNDALHQSIALWQKEYSMLAISDVKSDSANDKTAMNR